MNRTCARGLGNGLAGAALVFVAGLWLASDIHPLGETWVVLSLALYAVAIVLGAAGGQRPKRARCLARELARIGEGASPELEPLVHDPWSRSANYASSALVVVILVLMVWQPGR